MKKLINKTIYQIKKYKVLIISCICLITLMIIGVSMLAKKSRRDTRQEVTTEEILLSGSGNGEEYEDINESAANAGSTSSPGQPDKMRQTTSNMSDVFSDIPEYSGEMYIVVNEDIPFFEEGDLTTSSYVRYSSLDSLGRCGSNVMVVSSEDLPDEERGEIGRFKPSGWHQNKYPGIVDSDPPYVINRSHLLMWAMTGNDSNRAENLITGTRKFNVEGMLPNETIVLDYVKNSGNHVIYRVTPYFDGDNLMADGVLIEAMSIEDSGESLHLCRWVYNVQPGVVFDYSTGENELEKN